MGGRCHTPEARAGGMAAAGMTDMVLPAVVIQHSDPEITEKLVQPQPLTLPSPPAGGEQLS